MAAIHRLINVFLRRAWTGQFTRRPCSHLDMSTTSSQPRRRASNASPWRHLAGAADVPDLRARRVL
jgi:hypothetical protein